MKAYHWQRLIEERNAEAMAKGLPTPQPRPAVAANHPKVNTRKGPPLCIECAHHSCAFDWFAQRVVHRCYDVMTRDPVTGAPTDPYANRKSAISCGPTGSYWRAKPAASTAVVGTLVEADERAEPDEYVPPVPVRRIDLPFIDAQVIDLIEVARAQ